MVRAAPRARPAAALAQLRGEHARGGLVVRDVQDPLDRARHDLEAPGRCTLRSPCATFTAVERRQHALQARHGAAGTVASASSAASAVAALRYWMAPASAEGGSP